MVSKTYQNVDYCWAAIKARAQNFDAEVIKNLLPLYEALPYADNTLIKNAQPAYQ